MKKVYQYDNCKVIIHMPEDDSFKERLRKASENFMKKMMSDGNKSTGSKRNGR